MSLRRQTNVTLSLETARKMDQFARVFHRGEFAPVARTLIEEALRKIQTEMDYLAAMKRSRDDEAMFTEGTREIEPTSHISETVKQISKENEVDTRVQIGKEIYGAGGRKKKGHRSKAS